MVGLTTELPNDVPHHLSGTCSSASSHEWVYFGNYICYKKQRSDFPDLPSLNDLTPGNSVGLLVTPNGQLDLFLDGEYRCEIANGLPVDTPLWGVADVYGPCAKIKSEILSGESSDVSHCYLHSAQLHQSREKLHVD